MRIINGTHKGRSIHPPGNLPVRPTTDFGKESIFNVLNNFVDFTEIKVLDLFSGTGNMTYEFASRGAKDITAVDMNYKCYAFIKKTAEEFGFQMVKAVKNDSFTYIKNCKDSFDLIFADPPYEHEKIELIPSLIFEKQLLRAGGWLIMEHSAKNDFQKHEHFLERRSYGKVNFSIFGWKDE